jgi:hypothetical protein
MKTVKEIEQDIIEITMKINSEFPELSKYISEMPLEVPDKNNMEISLKSFHDYYDSLEQLLKNYRDEVEEDE